MKALFCRRYGSADILSLEETAKPIPLHSEVLVKVHATTVNRTDCAAIRAKPFFARFATGLFRPKRPIPGSEFAGDAEIVGEGVKSCKAGDRVFGFDDMGTSAHAQYLTVREDKLQIIPADISYQQAAAGSEGAHYSRNFINKVTLEPGQRVLVNGATGAIGSAAIQFLVDMDIEVTAVCAGQHTDLVRGLGATRVIDYTKVDFTKDPQRFHCVFDTVGKSSFFKCRHLLLPGGVYISSDLGFLAQNLYLPLLTPLVGFLLAGKRTKFPLPDDVSRSLRLVRELRERGSYRALIDREYTLEQIKEAYRYVEQGKKTGNVVISVSGK